MRCSELNAPIVLPALAIAHECCVYMRPMQDESAEWNAHSIFGAMDLRKLGNVTLNVSVGALVISVLVSVCFGETDAWCSSCHSSGHLSYRAAASRRVT